MTEKFTHEALKKRVKELEKEVKRLKKSEIELRDSEAQLRAFMNNYPAVIYIKDEEGRHVFANDAALKFANRKMEDFLGTTSRDLFPPDTAKKLEDRDKFVLKKGIPTDLEYQYEMPDGQVRWTKDIKFPIRLAEQTLLGGIAVDITERKRVEQALREQIEFERLIADIATKLAQTDPERLGETLDFTLRSLGQFLRTDRSFLAQFSDDETSLKHTNIWAAAGINVPSSLFELDMAADLPWLAQHIRNGEAVITGPSLTGLPDEAKELRHWLEHNGINSGVVVPVSVEGRSIGFLGLDTLVHPREYPQSMVDRLKIVADMIGSTLRRVQADEKLRESQDDLRRLAGKLISTQEAERRRLAREMHDDISQRLAVLAIDAGKLEQLHQDPEEPLFDKLQDMRQRLVDLSSDIHAISRQLHPSIIDDLGLVDAVRTECEGFTRREGTKVKCIAEGVPTKIPKDVSICIYRIIQEGMRNIAKHAQTKDAHVSLSGKDDSVHLTIKDNGIGFDPAEAKKKPGLGLASMEERVRLIQGDILIKSQLGKGTLIEVKAPFGAKHKPRL